VSAVLAVQRRAAGVRLADAGHQALILIGVPVSSILHRAGHSRWWLLIAIIPLINLIGLWVFAFTRWPAIDSAST